MIQDHPVAKVVVEICSIGTVISYWLDLLPHAVGVFATTATGVYCSLQAFYLFKNKGKS